MFICQQTDENKVDIVRERLIWGTGHSTFLPCTVLDISTYDISIANISSADIFVNKKASRSIFDLEAPASQPNSFLMTL
jgi:hypothetical protein